MERQEIEQLLAVLNDNEDGKVFDSNDWVVIVTKQILTEFNIDNINIYGRGEIETLKQDIASLKTEVILDADHNHVTAISSNIELYANDEKQYLDFETDHEVYINYKDSKIELIDDLKESEEVLFEPECDLILIKNEYVFTSETGLKMTRDLTIYIPYNLTEVFDEEVDL